MKKILGFLAVLALAGYGIWYFFGNTDERQIRNLVEDLREAASRPGTASAAQIALSHPILSEYFAPVCVIEVPRSTMGGEYDPQRLAGDIVRVTLMLKRADMTVNDLVVAVDTPEFARASFNGRYRGEGRAGWMFDEAREVNLELRKSDGKWRISRISAPEILVK